MTDDTPAFQDLLRITASYPTALNPVELHGFLTGIVIGPDDTADEPILSAVYGYSAIDRIHNYEELGEFLWGAADEITEDLIDASFDVLLRSDDASPEDPALWMLGFNKAVALNEAGWEELNDTNIETGKKYAYLQSLANPDLAQNLIGVAPDEYDAYLEEALPLLQEALIALYRGYWLDRPSPLTNLTIEDLPSVSPQALARQSADELLQTILTYDDLLPRNVVDEAIQRGQPMAQRLRRHLEDPSNWSDEVPVGRWWGLIHATLILGSTCGEDATQGLLHLIRRMDSNGDDDLWDWLGNHWPALFRNKRATAAKGLQSVVDNRSFNWYPRATALDCLVEAAQATGPDELDARLQSISRIVEDESEDWDFRLSASRYLLDFPRDAYRQTLKELALKQEELEEYPHYRMCDVDDAYHRNTDKPEWKRFGDPLSFYDPENILSRQIRWSVEDEGQLLDDPLFEDSGDLPYPDDLLPPSTYVRETPKVGRNDPCPCGSGKKYKKCCLQKPH